jgi:hypothetical protein
MVTTIGTAGLRRIEHSGTGMGRPLALQPAPRELDDPEDDEEDEDNEQKQEEITGEGKLAPADRDPAAAARLKLLDIVLCH